MGDVRAYLSGGPEEGREVSIATDHAGLPVPRVTLPARRAPGSRTAPSGQHSPLLIYERHRSRPDGTWEFRYVGAEAAN